MKIVVAGASVGGLLSAYKLGKAGNDVVVLEKKPFEELGYDWHDFVWHDFFEQLDMDDINIDRFVKNNMSFDIFGYDEIVRLNQKESDREYAISRKELSHFLVEKTSQYCKIIFNKTVDALLLENDCVKGVAAGGEKFYADLVIDNLGVFSTLRKQLPDCAGVQKEVEPASIMFAYRAVFEKQSDIVVTDDTKCYLRHLGGDGISWVNIEHDNKVDVLIGRIGGLSLETANQILAELKKDNPCIGGKLISGGQVYPIPVRYPSTKLFHHGYVMIGESAFMTVPLLGSGIYSSVVAANILFEVLQNEDISQSNLYKYQQQFYAKAGADFFEIDVIKTFLLNSDISKLLVLLKNGVVDGNDITDIYNAKPFNYSFKQLLKKGAKGWRHPLILLKMLSLLNKTKKIKRLVKSMPETYDEKKLAAWQKKTDSFFKAR